MNLIDFHCDTLMRLYDIAQHPDSNESTLVKTTVKSMCPDY